MSSKSNLAVTVIRFCMGNLYSSMTSLSDLNVIKTYSKFKFMKYAKFLQIKYVMD